MVHNDTDGDDAVALDGDCDDPDADVYNAREREREFEEMRGTLCGRVVMMLLLLFHDSVV